MSTPKVFTDAPRVYSEREKVLAEREAYQSGVNTMYMNGVVPATPEACQESVRLLKLAATRYPLPKVTRPRVVETARSGYEWRIVGGALQERRIDTELWRIAEGWVGDPENMRVLADLLANPTEEVDDDGSPS